MLLLSVKPKFAEKIVSGEKRVEFRRVWAARDVDDVAIYSTAPVSKLVAIAEVQDVIESTAAGLWALAQVFGGGITKRELAEYISGKRSAFGIIFTNVLALDPPIARSALSAEFAVPQSFRYMTVSERRIVSRRAAK